MNTPRTDALLDDMDEGYPDRWIVSHTSLERELAAAIEQRDEMKLALRDLTDAAKGLMDCKGYDLYPNGTMRPAHGLGEWVKAEDYDKLHAAAEAAQADAKRYRWLRGDKRGRSLSVSSLEWTGNAKLSDAAVDAAMRIRWL